MKCLPASAPLESSTALREQFLLTGLFTPGAVNLAYWETERTVVGGAVPLGKPIPLKAPEMLGAATFCERRELGVINLGGPGRIEVDGTSHAMGPRDGLYVGRGTKTVVFHSDAADKPARYYLLSYPAHREFPVAHIPFSRVKCEKLGGAANANQRSLYKYVAPGLVESCQLVMGFTEMAEGSVWNTMPPHTHLRRSEVYCYFNVPADHAVFHFMGQPSATRHLVIRDLEVALSPPWSIHSGVGTAAYAFVWGMGGENQDFADMQRAPISELS